MTSELTLRHFWQSNDITKTFLINLVSECSQDAREVVLTSVFVKTPLTKKIVNYLKVRYGLNLQVDEIQQRSYNLAPAVTKTDVKNIWYTGENLRPPSDDNWDVTLSFEPDSKINRNIHLPFWATRLGVDVTTAKKSQEFMLTYRSGQSRRKKFACAFVGNPEPFRLKAIKEIAKLGNVDCYGTAYGKPVKDKMSILNEYQFNICFENDLYPGYVTEKVIESWVGGAIPIWWGLDSMEYLNTDAIFNFALSEFDNGIEQLGVLMNDRNKLEEMQSSPLLKRKYDYDHLVTRLSDFMNQNNLS
jgi:hypothetical protein